MQNYLKKVDVTDSRYIHFCLVYFTYSPGITMVISDSAKLAQG